MQTAERDKKRTARAVPVRTATVQALVMSQHDAVRCQLVAYLSRSPGLAVSGVSFSPEAIGRASPDVVVLDLSQIGPDGLGAALAAAQAVGARLIALASMRVPADEALVREGGGLYLLKTAGADGLAEHVQRLGTRPATIG
jgi:DNA-binding NarL/FixJ family response regulator